MGAFVDSGTSLANTFIQKTSSDESVKHKMAQITSSKKVVSRTVAIGLGVVCIALAAGLVIALVLYAPMVANQQSSDLQSQIADQDSTIASLNSQVSSLNTQVSSLATQVASLKSSLEQSYSLSDVQNITAELNQQISDYQAMLSLSKSGYLIQNYPMNQTAGTATAIYNDYLDYAGYVGVQVESNSSTTYARVMYALPVTEEIFDYNVTVGTSGSTVLPVLPGTVSIGIGNTELVDAVNVTVTAVYYY
jgi:uncharacterized coiled-coil protein SlyX